MRTSAHRSATGSVLCVGVRSGSLTMNEEHAPIVNVAGGEFKLIGGRPTAALPLATIVGGEVLEGDRSEEHTSELQSLMRISYAVFCLKKKTKQNINNKQ